MKKRYFKQMTGLILVLSMLILLIPTNVAFAASGQDVVDYAYNTWKGTPWKSRGSVTYAPGVGVDCSALMQYAYNHYGYSISSSTYTQRYEGINIDHSALKYSHDYSLLQPGDLIFFNNYEHVGMYAGNGYFVHASYSRGVVKQVLYGDGYNWHQYACEVRRIITHSPPVHIHSWSYGNDSGHPHREYKYCSCGEKQYTGGTRLVSTCQQCYPLGNVNLTRSFSKTAKDVTLYRNNVTNANSYTLTLYKDGSSYGTYSMTSTSKYVSGLPSGTYTATLTAKNTNTGQSKSVSCDSFTIVDTYDVIYDANGGTNAPSSQLKIKDTDLTITSSIPMKIGYVFKGWASNKTATEPQYLPGGVYNKNTRITLYAVWEPEIYTINFDANSGKGELESTTITYGNSMKMPNSVIRDGYYLKGWSQTKGATTPDYKLGIDYKLTSNMTLYAVWGQSTWGGTVAAEFAGGDGTEENPYQISNAAELAHLADIVNNQQSEPEYKYYILTDNINLGYEEWIPIGLYGNENQYFKGSFDGNGYTISDLSITDVNEGYIGLFGCAKDSEIKNLTVSGDITGITNNVETYIGTIVSCAYNTNIDNCIIAYVNISDIIGESTNTYVIGGICGYIEGNITNCSANECYIGIKDGYYFFTGMIAGIALGKILNCNVKSTEELFGFVETIDYLYLGGIVGAVGSKSTIASQIECCFVEAGFLVNDVNVSSRAIIGGIAGEANASTILDDGSIKAYKADIKYCSVKFNNGKNTNVNDTSYKSSIEVNGSKYSTQDYYGGIVGTGANISNCKYDGQSIIVSRQEPVGNRSFIYAGGIAGTSSIDRCFSKVDGIVYSNIDEIYGYIEKVAYAGGIAGSGSVSNSVAIADMVSSYSNGKDSESHAYSSDITNGTNYENVYSYSSMELSAENPNNSSLAKTTTVGAKRTLAQIKRASFLNQVFGPAYQSLDYLEENPDAVWVIKDGEYPELYFNLLNDITISEVENGTITVDKTQAVDGEIVTVTAAPDENYLLNKIYVNGNEIVGNTFEVSGDSDVYATFAEIPAEYNVAVKANENAAATLVNVDKINSLSLFSNTTSLSATDGEEIKVNTTPSDDYTVDAVYVNGEELASDSFIVTDDSVVTMDVASISTEIKATTYDATDIKGNAATLGGKIEGDYDNVSKYILYWKADAPEVIYTTAVEEGSGEYQVTVTDLELYAEYQYQMTENGEIKSFVTEYEHFDDSGSSSGDRDDNVSVYPVFEIKNSQNGTDAIAFDVVNNSTVAASGTLIIAAYDADGKLISTKIKMMENISAGASKEYEIEVSDAEYYKVLIWDSLTNILPLANSVRIE